MNYAHLLTNLELLATLRKGRHHLTSLRTDPTSPWYRSTDWKDNVMRSYSLTSAAEPQWADFERKEPRCRICRDETVRILVNELLDWHGTEIILGPGKTHVITYADILRDLEPLNRGRDKSKRITYDSLWVHAKRHYNLDGVTAYWKARMDKELMKTLGG